MDHFHDDPAPDPPQLTERPGWLAFLFVMAAIAAVLATVLWLTGCGIFVPKEKSSLIEQEQRESIAAKTTADVVSATKTIPPNVTITTTGKDGTQVEVTQPVAQESKTTSSVTAGEESDSAASGNAAWVESIPMFVKLIGLGIAILFLMVIFWLIRRSSKAVDAAWKTADGMIAQTVHQVRTQATNTTDPGESKGLKAAEAELLRLQAEAAKD